jgi:protein-S-isoprenylcysteine O-methyltransferase Ste14
MPPRTSPVVVAAVIAAALGVCALFAAVTVPALIGGVGPWVLAGGGAGLLIAAMLVLAGQQRRRGRSLP